MFKYASSFLLLAIASSLIVAQDTSQNSTATKVGWSGTLSSLDGGLGGTVTVIDENTLNIMNYVLKDAGAPALYWWGSTNEILSDGFRISNKQVTQKSDGSDFEIMLDASKTTADFSVVGLWCERLASNFGQTTLKASGSGPSASGSASATAASSAVASSPTSAATHSISLYREIFAPLIPVIGLFFWLR
jgi:Electron transfer DM13